MPDDPNFDTTVSPSVEKRSFIAVAIPVCSQTPISLPAGIQAMTDSCNDPPGSTMSSGSAVSMCASCTGQVQDAGRSEDIPAIMVRKSPILKLSPWYARMLENTSGIIPSISSGEAHHQQSGNLYVGDYLMASSVIYSLQSGQAIHKSK